MAVKHPAAGGRCQSVDDRTCATSWIIVDHQDHDAPSTTLLAADRGQCLEQDAELVIAPERAHTYDYFGALRDASLAVSLPRHVTKA